MQVLSFHSNLMTSQLLDQLPNWDYGFHLLILMNQSSPEVIHIVVVPPADRFTLTSLKPSPPNSSLVFHGMCRTSTKQCIQAGLDPGDCCRRSEHLHRRFPRSRFHGLQLLPQLLKSLLLLDLVRLLLFVLWDIDHPQHLRGFLQHARQRVISPRQDSRNPLSLDLLNSLLWHNLGRWLLLGLLGLGELLNLGVLLGTG